MLRHGSPFLLPGVCYRLAGAGAYVEMTRGKDDNHLFIYQPTNGESDHEHLTPTTAQSLHVPL